MQSTHLVTENICAAGFNNPLWAIMDCGHETQPTSSLTSDLDLESRLLLLTHLYIMIIIIMSKVI